MKYMYYRWRRSSENETIRNIMKEHALYEKTYKHSRFLNFIDDSTIYPNGFAIVLSDYNNNIIGLLFADLVHDDIIQGVLRKKTDLYGFSGIATKKLDHRFRPVAVVGVYIKPEYRGNNYSALLIENMEHQLIDEYANYFYYQKNDIPIFQFYDDGMDIAQKTLKHSYAVHNIEESKQRREELHAISSNIENGVTIPSWQDICLNKWNGPI